MNRPLSLFRTLLIATVLGGCSGKSTTIDFDRDANFSQFKTFAYKSTTPAEDQLMDRRIVAAIEEELSQEGIQKVDANPDVYTTYHAATQSQRSWNTTGMGYGYGPGWYWGGGMGTTTTREVQYEVGTLVIDVWDAKKKQLVFRGLVSGTISDNPQKNAKNIRKAVAEIFEKYPPKSAE